MDLKLKQLAVGVGRTDPSVALEKGLLLVRVRVEAHEQRAHAVLLQEGGLAASCARQQHAKRGRAEPMQSHRQSPAG